MTTRRLDSKVDSKCPCPSDSDDIAIDTTLRPQKVKGRIPGGRPSLFLFVSEQINCKPVNSSCGQLLGYILPRVACAVALRKQEHARTWFCGSEVSCLHNRAIG